MRVLMLKDYYYPEQCAGIDLALDLVEGFTLRNNEVTVYTPIPCRGISKSVRDDYSKIKKETIGSTTIFRYWLPYEKAGTISRFFRYILQNLIQISKGLSAEYDVLLLGSTPPTMGIVGTILKKIKKRPFVYNVQDIFPDSLVNTGMAHKGGLLWKIGRKIEDFTYNHADKIIVISQGFKRNIMEKGVPEEKIEVISNWIDLDSVHPVERKDNTLVSEFGLDPSKFIVVYAGNFGAAQGADIVLKAAKELAREKDIQFVIFGGGSYFEDAKKEAEGLENVFIHELMPQDRISEVYSLGDVALITCKAGTGNAGMPSKTWSIMACNTPIIASFDTDSDLADVIRDSGAGECVEPESVQVLTEAIFKQFTARKNGSNEKSDLRTYVEHNASKEICVERYIDCILAFQ